MKKIVLFSSFLLFIFSLFAQIPQPKNALNIDSKPILEKGIDYYANNSLKYAEVQFEKVPEGDYYYDLAQYYLALTYITQGKDVKSVTLLLEELYNREPFLEKYLEDNTFPTPVFPMVSSYLINLYTLQERYDDALKTYEKASSHFPYNKLLHYTMANCYVEREEYKKAIYFIEKAIFCSPYEQTYHYFLALCYKEAGLPIHSLLALNFALFLAPDSERGKDILNYLEHLYTDTSVSFFSNDEYPELFKIEKAKYGKAKELLIHFISHNESSSTIQTIMEGNRVLFQALEKEGEQTIAEDLYIPLFKNRISNNYSEYISFLFYDQIKATTKSKKKQDKIAKKIVPFVIYSYHLINSHLDRGIGDFIPQDCHAAYVPNEEDLKKIDGNTALFGREFAKISKGELKKIEENTYKTEREIPLYPTILISENGTIVQIDSVISKEKSIVYTFTPHGYLERRQENVNDVSIGNAYYSNYYDKNNPLLDNSYTLQGNRFEGKLQHFNSSGVMIFDLFFKNGELNGENFTYFDQGNLSQIEFFNQGKSSSFSLYPMGDTMSTTQLLSNDLKYVRSFYPKHRIYRTYTEKDDVKTGELRQYFENGQLSYIQNFDDDGNKKNGIFFHSNGVIRANVEYEDNQYSKVDFYSNRNVKYYATVFADGELRKVQLFDTSGAVKEEFNIPEGVEEFMFHVKNEFDEPYQNIKYQKGDPYTLTYFDLEKDSSVSKIASYNKEDLDGNYFQYGYNGKLKVFAQYKDGRYNGLYISYFSDGTIRSEGYYGRRGKAWYSYYPNGQIKTITIYDDKGMCSSQKKYFYDGTLQEDFVNYNGIFAVIKNYNHRKELIANDTVFYGNGVMRSYFLNGKIASENFLKGGNYYGWAKYYRFDGSLLDSVYYCEKEVNGRAVFYNEAYENVAESFYREGRKDSQYYNFYLNGKVKSKNEVIDDVWEGSQNEYYSNGQLMTEIKVSNNEFDSIGNFYAVNGMLAYQFDYLDGRIVRYSYRDKDGKMTPFKPFPIESSFTAYYKNGTKAVEVAHTNGCLNGKFIGYFPNGKKITERTFAYHQYHGDYFEWYPNGNLMIKATYRDGRLHGDYEEYHENGKIAKKRNYVDDLMHGDSYEYDKAGTLIKTTRYFYGYIIDVIY